MRFMMLMIPKVYQGASGQKAGADFTPSPEEVRKMMKYNEELARAGALIALDGLQPPATGARVSFRGGRPVVSDGPFTEAREVLGGYWMIRAASREEAIDWARRVPAEEGDLIEVRQVFEDEDFPAETREAADSPVVREQLDRQRTGRRS
jgi:hypothetical protein